MRVIILAGGLGTRLTEETTLKPKPMVEIGGHPILWHIMKIYSAYGINEFVPTLGYKGEIIKNYFINYQNLKTSISVDISTGKITTYNNHDENWIVHLLDTGHDTQTGGRIKRAMQFTGKERVMATYGDGLANINIANLLEFHKSHGKLATLTAVRPPARYGEISFEGDQVIGFTEKPQVGKGWINGGFFVLEPEVIDYINSDDMPFERYPLETLSKEGQLMAYRHEGFWQPMDVIREKQLLEKLWQSGDAPWKVW
ncbi:MAG: glucose-1-phosphate cytidylyltransferase [Bacteroidetes bacterium]|jgi:glucose-1-phosphate cytidylyltransferase|nr:glucose-1-phosphate cytidylyltransferase [Bacteroidota bacterium]